MAQMYEIGVLAVVFSCFTYPILSKRGIIPFTKRHVIMLSIMILLFFAGADYLTSKALPTGKVKETASVSEFMYKEYSAYGLHLRLIVLVIFLPVIYKLNYSSGHSLPTLFLNHTIYLVDFLLIWLFYAGLFDLLNDILYFPK